MVLSTDCLTVQFPYCRYQNYLRRSRTENFSDLAGLGAFYKAGVDYMGRQIVVYVGRQFPAPKVDLSKVSMSISTPSDQEMSAVV